MKFIIFFCFSFLCFLPIFESLFELRIDATISVRAHKCFWLPFIFQSLFFKIYDDILNRLMEIWLSFDECVLSWIIDIHNMFFWKISCRKGKMEECRSALTCFSYQNSLLNNSMCSCNDKKNVHNTCVKLIFHFFHFDRLTFNAGNK